MNPSHPSITFTHMPIHSTPLHGDPPHPVPRPRPPGVHPLQLWGKTPPSTHHIKMTGPGGVGHADVAVTVCSTFDVAADPASGDQQRPVVGSSPPGAVQLRKRLFSSAVKLAGAAARAARGACCVLCCAPIVLGCTGYCKDCFVS